jgi:hypothetical protein
MNFFSALGTSRLIEYFGSPSPWKAVGLKMCG